MNVVGEDMFTRAYEAISSEQVVPAKTNTQGAAMKRINQAKSCVPCGDVRIAGNLPVKSIFNENNFK